MIYLAGALVAFVLFLRFTAPVRYAVHGSSGAALPFGIAAQDRWTPGLLNTPHGAKFSVRGKFIGHAVRDSMARFGIGHGSTFLGDYLDADGRAKLVHGDIVVVDGETEGFETGRRLRRLDRIEAGVAYFLPDGYEQPRSSRPADQIVVKVTYVVRPSDPFRDRGLVAGLWSKLAQRKAA